MERLFSPCIRLRHRLESQGRRGSPELSLELNLDVSPEELLSAEMAFTYANLYAMFGIQDMVAWLTPHAAVVRGGESVVHVLNYFERTCGFCCTADCKNVVVLGCSYEHVLEISDVVLRLLAVSVVHSLIIQKCNGPGDAFNISAPSLAYLMEQCQSLKVLTLKDLKMDENYCRVLGDYSRPGLEIVLNDCKITSAGASALAEVLGRNQGPTKLVNCQIDNSVLANGLRGNNRLKSFRPRISGTPEDCKREVLEIACALRENSGLVDFDLSYSNSMTDETWDAVCDSLKAHPTLQVLNIWSTGVPFLLKYRVTHDTLV
jgi:hypothetical protein